MLQAAGPASAGCTDFAVYGGILQADSCTATSSRNANSSQGKPKAGKLNSAMRPRYTLGAAPLKLLWR